MILNDLIAIKEKEIAGRKKIVLRCCMAAGCMSSDSKGVKEQLEKAVADAGLQNEVEVRGVGCMKLCCEGPLVAADPDNKLYVKVNAESAPSIVAALKGGKTSVSQSDPNAAFFSKQLSIVLANSGIVDPERIESYIAADGYQALHEVLARNDAERSRRGHGEKRFARARRRGIPHRAEMGHGRQIAGREKICDLQRRRR